MFERFTERARIACILAQDEARDHGYDAVRSEHLLLGLLREEEGLASRVLRGFGVTVDNIRHGLPRGPIGEMTNQPVFSLGVKNIFDLALRESLALGQDWIGTEHLLLALGSSRLAESFLTDPAEVREAVYRLLNPPYGFQRPDVREPTTCWAQEAQKNTVSVNVKLEDESLAGIADAVESAILEGVRRALAKIESA